MKIYASIAPPSKIPETLIESLKDIATTMDTDKIKFILGKETSEYLQIFLDNFTYPDSTDFWDGNWINTNQTEIHSLTKLIDDLLIEFPIKEIEKIQKKQRK
ncbi:MAG: hypothetical protein MUF43_11195 [Flavobacterium sp.]|nr:hypothetical protein [Flavobacterium sp.]